MSKESVFVWLAAIIGVIFISTSATVFAAIKGVDPYMKSAWRTQITCFAYLIPFLYYLKTSPEKYKIFLRTHLKRTSISGIALGLHYSSWVLSIDLTSIAHSLLFACSTPILMIVYYFIKKQPVKKSEVFGAIVGFAGMIIMCLDEYSSEGATLFGDIMALIGAMTIGVCWVYSKDLVASGGFCYLCIMHAITTLTCIFCSVSYNTVVYGFDGLAVFGEVFAWIWRFDGIYALYLGIGVGFIGNGCFYFMLKYTSSLVVAIVNFFEPIGGSIFAWWLGYQADPNMFTWIGGFIILIGNFIVGIFARFDELKIKKPVDEEKLITEEQVVVSGI